MALKVLLFSLFFSLQSWSAVTSYKPVDFTVTEQLKLKIIGLKGRVILRGVSSPTKEGKIFVKKISDSNPQNNPWQMSVSQDKDYIQLKAKGPTERSAWFGPLSVPEFEVTVVGHPLPVEIFWQDGSVSETGWQSSVNITMVQGNYFSEGGHGQRHVAINKSGGVTVNRLKGDFEAQLFESRLKLENSEGKVEIDNFSGISQLNNHNGDSQLKSYNGRFELNKVQGDVTFSLTQGSFEATNFQGKMQGKGKESALTVRYEGASNISLSSTSGTVRVVTPSNSGARVEVHSGEGNLFVPNLIRVTRTAASKSGVGRLSGQLPSWVYVKTASGDISLK